MKKVLTRTKKDQGAKLIAVKPASSVKKKPGCGCGRSNLKTLKRLSK